MKALFAHVRNGSRWHTRPNTDDAPSRRVAPNTYTDTRQPPIYPNPVAPYPLLYAVLVLWSVCPSSTPRTRVTDARPRSPPSSSCASGTPSLRKRLARARTPSSPLARSASQNAAQSASGPWVSSYLLSSEEVCPVMLRGCISPDGRFQCCSSSSVCSSSDHGIMDRVRGRQHETRSL